METLTIKLKQHTPLLHFQPGQEGATLRASEVKPRLDKFLFGRTGVKYKLRVQAESPVVVSIPVEESRNRDKSLKTSPFTGDQLFQTSNYPGNGGTLVIGNIGGREKEKVLNLVLYESTSLIFSVPDLSVAEKIKDGIILFIGSTNFGNRKTKGFGSYSVSSICFNGTKVSIDSKEDPNYIGIIKENVLYPNHGTSQNQTYSKLFKAIFLDINQYWSAIKRKQRGRRADDLRNVLLGETKQDSVILDKLRLPISRGESRIPSPLLFKPFWWEKDNGIAYRIELYFVPDMLDEIANKCKATIEVVQDYYYNLFDYFQI